MQCEECAAWTEMNTHTNVGRCNYPRYRERGEFTFMQTHANTRCHLSAISEAWLRTPKIRQPVQGCSQ